MVFHTEVMGAGTENDDQLLGFSVVVGVVRGRLLTGLLDSQTTRFLDYQTTKQVD